VLCGWGLGGGGGDCMVMRDQDLYFFPRRGLFCMAFYPAGFFGCALSFRLFLFHGAPTWAVAHWALDVAGIQASASGYRRPARFSSGDDEVAAPYLW